MSRVDTINHVIFHSRQQLLELCIGEGILDPKEAADFRQFCDLLAAYYHFEFHKIEEALKCNYSPFNPDASVVQRSGSLAERAKMEAELLELLEHTLQRANYRSLDWVAIQQAVQLADLVDIKTDIDFHDYEQLVLFYRGESKENGTRQKFLWKQRIAMNVYANVILGLKFKEKEHFLSKGRKLEKLTFQPGSIYFYLYKNIPQNDLELLFPNVQLSMNLFDRILFVVPALGAAISMFIKIVPNLLLLVGVITFLIFGPSFSERLGVSESQIHEASPVMFALSSVLLALGGFAYKQYDSYKNKRIRFMKNVTETLFFRNLATNSSVFHSVVDVAEEEECKEAILVYYQMLIHKGSMSRQALEQSINVWMKKQYGSQSSFDTTKVINRLNKLSTEIVNTESATTPCVKSLLAVTPEGICHIPTLTEATHVIDKLWDSAYEI